tara:strand:- start:1841 stop:1963 length:123 start_codon:yes stop_codon:yes gene_type:complete
VLELRIVKTISSGKTKRRHKKHKITKKKMKDKKCNPKKIK